MKRERPPLDLAAIRAKLEGARGQQYWRTLEEVAETPEFAAFLEDEFPSRADEWAKPVNRRELLRLMGSSFALAGLVGCTKQPTEKAVPYVKSPEDHIPGRPNYFATSMPFHGTALGLLVESHEGRPTKVEGNPQHPESHGTANVYAQASTLDLYDPDRSQTTTFRGRITSFDRFLSMLAGERPRWVADQGAGLRILTGGITSPSLGATIKAVQGAYPRMQWHQWEPVQEQMTLGEPHHTIYKFDQADVVLALDADFLLRFPGSQRYSYDYIQRRRAENAVTASRLYVVEPMPTITGDMADHRLPLRASEIEAFARAVSGGGAGQGSWAQFAATVAKDLQASAGRSIVVAGESQPPAVHLLAHAINEKLGNIGKTVIYTEPLLVNPVDYSQSLRDLVGAIKAGQVQALLMVETNPVYTAPADWGFAENLARVPLRMHTGLYQDETARVCHWHIPAAHFLESWGDTRAYDGTVALQQPLISPLYDGRTAYEIINSLGPNIGTSPYTLVQEYWRSQRPGDNFDDVWETALHDGVLPGTQLAAKTITPRDTGNSTARPTAAQGLEVVFRADPTVYDGRYANNGWLQECPKPHTKLTWDNAVHLSPRTAERLGLTNEQRVQLEYRGRMVDGAVWVTPGHADEAATIHLGYGRTAAGQVGNRNGFDAYALRTSDAMWHGQGLTMRKLEGKYPLACTQIYHNIEGRDIIRQTTVAEYKQDQEKLRKEEDHEWPKLNIYPGWSYPGYAWAMAIDMSACIGCNACIVACQAENNIPVVGKDQIRRGREMHWLRIDTYFFGGIDNPSATFQPVMCMHCENAPCEPVCPVAATVHSGDGLNQMVYNRCVGTRYCSNNCPYKVRRFNYYLYQDWDTPQLEPLRNPEVSVRSRGVMEKCTYCIQRIATAKIETEKENRSIRDGEVQTACQTTCPTNAIIFGDQNDKGSRVAKLKALPLNYGLLAELNTQPRTTYLGRLRNPHPELERA